MDARDFLQYPDVLGESGLNTYWSKEYVLEHIQSVIDHYERELAEAKARAVPDGWVAVDPARVRLWDSQWVNIVNHAQCYEGWSKDDAIAHAVRLTEQAIERNVRSGVVPSARPDPKEPSDVE
jgi:hypothetical protein